MNAYAKKDGNGTRRIAVSASEGAVTVRRSFGSPGGTFPVDDPAAVVRAIAADLEEDGYAEEGP